MTSSLEIQTQSDFLTFIKDEAMTNGNLSIRGVARCCDVPHTSLIRGGALKSNKLGETLSSKGFHAGALTENGFPPQAVWLCSEYFAYVSQAEAPMAKQLARTFGAIGVLETLKQLTKPNPPTPIASPLDAQVQLALALAGGGALAIEAFKLIHGIPNTPTAAAPASPEPKPTKPKVKPTKATKHTKAVTPPISVLSKAEIESEARELVQSFMRDVETMVSAGILGLWDVADVKQNFKPCTAIVLQSVIPLLEAHFSYQIDRARLEAAIVIIGGKQGQNQRFLPESPADRNNGNRSIVRKCSVIPDGWV